MRGLGSWRHLVEEHQQRGILHFSGSVSGSYRHSTAIPKVLLHPADIICQAPTVVQPARLARS